MNFLKSTVLAVSASALLAGCGIYGIGNPNAEDVLGRWVETGAAPAGVERGYVFEEKGRVTSFGMDEEARSFACNKGIMVMKSVQTAPDGRKLDVIDTWEVTKPDDDTMVLVQGLERRTFRRGER